MRRRSEQEREEADAHAQAEARREALLAELKAREAAGRAPEPPAANPVEAESEERAEPELHESGPLTEPELEEGPGEESETA
jgi:hypothetical protein